MVLLLYVVVCAAMAYVIVDIARTPRDNIRVLSKPVWIMIILLFGLLLGPIGCVLWFIFGRPPGTCRNRCPRSAASPR